MIFLDINTFFTPKGGGIKTYHREKIKWFKKHQEHRYIICHPSSIPKTNWLAPNVTLYGMRGVRLTRDKEGYRLMVGYLRIAKIIHQQKPDFIEVGDPWLSTLFCWLCPLPKNSKLLSFWHTDAQSAYFMPWAKRPSLFKPSNLLLAKILSGIVHLGQKRFHTVICTTKVMEKKLKKLKVRNVMLAPFGSDPQFFAIGDKRENLPIHPKKILYAGRLDEEKDMQLFFSLIPILSKKGYTLTVAGRGKCEGKIKSLLPHPNLNYLGYVSNQETLFKLYEEHTLFLATGPAETFGIGILQALAAGCVVIGSPQCGAGELIGSTGMPLYITRKKLKKIPELLDSLTPENLRERSRASLTSAKKFGTWQQAMSRQIEKSLQL